MTAVEWYNQQLVDRQNGNGDSRSRDEIFEQAKEMEKEQKIEFAKHFLYKCKDLSIVMAHNQAEQELIKHELNKSE